MLIICAMLTWIGLLLQFSPKSSADSFRVLAGIIAIFIVNVLNIVIRKNFMEKFQRLQESLNGLHCSTYLIIALPDICSALLLCFHQYFQTFLNMYFQRILKHLNIWTGSFEAKMPRLLWRCTKMLNNE